MTDERHADLDGSRWLEPTGLDATLRAVADALRQPVEPSAGFETRVMAAVREAATVREITFRPWWRRRIIQLTPVAATALAAGIAFLAFLGARVSADGERPAQVVTAPAAPSTQVVRFVFVDPAAHNVAVVGSFNQWQKGVTPLHATSVPGVWSISIPLPAGMHEYAFVVDGERWAPDQFAPSVTDEFGTQSSIVRVQGPTSS